LDKFKNQTVEVAENIKMTQSKPFDLTMGNVNESSIKKCFMKLGPTNNKNMVEKSVSISSDYLSKTSGEFIINKLILDRCLVQHENVLSWKKIAKSFTSKQKSTPAKPVIPIVEETVAEAPAEETSVKADEKEAKTMSLEDLLESDNVDLFDTKNDKVNIYNDFFKNDK